MTSGKKGISSLLSNISVAVPTFLKSALEISSLTRKERESKKSSVKKITEHHTTKIKDITLEMINNDWNFNLNLPYYLSENPEYKFTSLKQLDAFLWRTSVWTLSYENAVTIYNATSEIILFRDIFYRLSSRVVNDCEKKFIAKCFNDNDDIQKKSNLETYQFPTKGHRVIQREIYITDEWFIYAIDNQWKERILWKWNPEEKQSNTVWLELAFRTSGKDKKHTRDDNEIIALKDFLYKVADNYWMRVFLRDLKSTRKSNDLDFLIEWNRKPDDFIRDEKCENESGIIKEKYIKSLNMSNEEIKLIESISSDDEGYENYCFCRVIALCITKMIYFPIAENKDNENNWESHFDTRELDNLMIEWIQFIKPIKSRDYKLDHNGNLHCLTNWWNSSKIIDTGIKDREETQNNLLRELATILSEVSGWLTAKDTKIIEFAILLLNIAKDEDKIDYLKNIEKTSNVKNIKTYLNNWINNLELDKNTKHKRFAIMLEQEYINELWLSWEEIELIKFFSWKNNETDEWKISYNFCRIIAVGLRNMIL